MNDIAIKVENLSKLYKIGARQERYRTLRDTLTEVVTAPFRRLSSVFGGPSSVLSHRSSVIHPLSSVLGHLSSVVRPRSSILCRPSSVICRLSSVLGHPSSVVRPRSSVVCNDTIWALKDISFEVKQGEVVGIIGRNGAGKTTLLKILSRITEPTEGYAGIHGRVASLLEVGTGFHPELTGRENIYLNGAILGMKKAEIDRKFDEIAAFAEIEKFIDTPVKHYSSGMYVRLAFAVASHLEPDILLVDEVLAVGDVAFQQKCIGKMQKVAGKGRTVLFVSHNMGSIGRLCQTALLLDQGRIAHSGEAHQVIERYLKGLIYSESEVVFPVDESKIIQIRSIKILDHMDRPRSILNRFFPFRVQIKYEVRKRVEGAYINFGMNAADGTRICECLDTDNSKEIIVREPGVYVSTVEFPGGILNSGSFVFCITLAKHPGPIVYRNFLIEGVNTKIDLFSWISVDFELEIVNRDFSVGIYNSIHSEAEDIFHRLERWSDFEFSKEMPFLF